MMMHQTLILSHNRTLQPVHRIWVSNINIEIYYGENVNIFYLLQGPARHKQSLTTRQLKYKHNRSPLPLQRL